MTQKTKKPDRPPRILVIDDERSVLDAIRMTLEHYGFGVTTCTSGLKAIEVFKTGKFDAVVTDYAMPELKGDDLAAMIKEISPGCPILMLTAHAEMVDRKKLKTVDCVLSKPFMPQALNAAIKRSLKQV
jgi:two-component system cell cycle sensor histidine kinase/response regulator CckA